MSYTGSEHKELQVAALADTVELSQPASSAADRHASAEQSDGAVVADALSHAARLSVPPRLQGVVCQPADRYDRGQPRVQREPYTTTSQGSVGTYYFTEAAVVCYCASLQ